MKIFLFVYLALVLVNVFIVGAVYIKNPKYFADCSFGLLTNVVAFFLWPVVWGRAIIEHILRNE